MRIPLFHIAFNGEANHLIYGVGANGDGLLEVSGELVCSVVSHIDYAFSPGLTGSLVKTGMVHPQLAKA